jgi:hypothetical protein
MVKTPKRPPRPVVARERIYSSGVYRHVMAMLEEMLQRARGNPDSLRFPQRHVDVAADCYSPFGFVQHWAGSRFVDVEPRRDAMNQWVLATTLCVIGDAGVAATDFRPVHIWFLMDQSTSRGIGYLTRAKTTPEELVGVLEDAIRRLEAVGPDGVFSLFVPPPLPEFYEPPMKPPRGVKLVDIEPER